MQADASAERLVPHRPQSSTSSNKGACICAADQPAGGTRVASTADAPSEDGSTPCSEGQPGMQTVQVDLLVLADDPDVHPSLAACFAANSLVWDGRLVVDAQLRTNDDHIYAAGTLAKFSRRWAEAPQP